MSIRRIKALPDFVFPSSGETYSVIDCDQTGTGKILFSEYFTTHNLEVLSSTIASFGFGYESVNVVLSSQIEALQDTCVLLSSSLTSLVSDNSLDLLSADVSARFALKSEAVALSSKGIALGVAPLDSSGFVPLSCIPLEARSINGGTI